MPGKIRLNPDRADAKRMYIREKRTLSITAKTLHEALAPTLPKAIKKRIQTGPLTSRDDISAGPPPLHSEKSKKRAVRSVGPLQSGSVLRLEPRPWTRVAKIADNSDLWPKSKLPVPMSKANSSKLKKVLSKGRENAVTQAKKKRKRTPNILRYDGQPRFEGGIRFVQGGAPELGRRR